MEKDPFWGVGLAPMEGVGELPVRLWLSQTSAPAFAMTPFLRVTKDYPARRIPATYAPEISVLRGAVNYALIPQIMGSSREDLVRIASHLLEHAPFVDFNCGCPSPTVVGHGSGSALLESERVFSDYVGSLVGELGKERMSLKMRTGFSSADEFESLAGVITRFEPVRVTVHGRTRAQRYLGRADWSLIEYMAKLVKLAGNGTTVVGSGDIVSPETFVPRAGAVGGNVIIGRGALRNPWIFSDVRPDADSNASLSRETLLTSLQAFALLQHLEEAMPLGLLQFVGESGLFLRVAGRRLEAWEELRDALAQLAGFDPRAPQNWALARGSFAKVKMIWNSMRSGLPEPLFAPEPLRAPSLGVFLARVDAALQAVAPEVVFRHHEHLDWVYSGGKEQT